MLIELTDGGVLNITSDVSNISGCETCDYRSSYVNEYSIVMTTGTVEIEVDNMYEYLLSEGYMMQLLLGNIDHIKTLSEHQFFVWLQDKINHDAEDAEKITVNFYEKTTG